MNKPKIRRDQTARNAARSTGPGAFVRPSAGSTRIVAKEIQKNPKLPNVSMPNVLFFFHSINPTITWARPP
jgi:hypothetical protein